MICQNEVGVGSKAPWLWCGSPVADDIVGIMPSSNPTPHPEVASRPYRLVIMVNMVAPYRVPVYDRIGQAFETTVLYSNIESNRTTWGGTLEKLKHCVARRSWGFTITLRKRGKDGVFDHRYKHITPGYFADLVRLRPHAILTYELGFRTMVALLYGFLYQVPVWVWWGGTIHSSAKIRKFNAWVRRFLARLTFRWIAYGASSSEYIRTLGVADSRILQIQNCVDEQLFLERVQPLCHPEVRPALLVVGHLVGLKGVYEMLDACAAVQGRGHAFSVYFIGDGPEKENLKQKFEQLGLKNVDFLAARKPEEMPAVYQSMDMLVFPTLNDVWGLVANEAILSGLPVLASRYAGCATELLEPEAIFDPLNPSEFAEALERAVLGKIPMSPPGRLKTCAQVADRIIRDVDSVLSS